MQKAMKYAILYDQDLEQAQITALAHDIAKEMSEKDSKKYIIKHICFIVNMFYAVFLFLTSFYFNYLL